MTVDETNVYLLRFAAGFVSPEDFEAALYADPSPLAERLSERVTHDPVAGESATTYERLLEVDVTARPEHARGIVRHDLEDAGIRWPVDEELVRHIEQALGVRLPAAYVEFAASRGPERTRGSEIELSEPAPPELAYYLGEGSWGIGEIVGLSYDARAPGLLASAAVGREWGLSDRLVPLDGDGHTFVALDYRDDVDDPPVVFVETDEGRSHLLAPSFAELVERLREPE